MKKILLALVFGLGLAQVVAAGDKKESLIKKNMVAFAVGTAAIVFLGFDFLKLSAPDRYKDSDNHDIADWSTPSAKNPGFLGRRKQCLKNCKNSWTVSTLSYLNGFAYKTKADEINWPVAIGLSLVEIVAIIELGTYLINKKPFLTSRLLGLVSKKSADVKVTK